jgi:hypothetical protein
MYCQGILNNTGGGGLAESMKHQEEQCSMMLRHLAVFSARILIFLVFNSIIYHLVNAMTVHHLKRDL